MTFIHSSFDAACPCTSQRIPPPRALSSSSSPPHIPSIPLSKPNQNLGIPLNPLIKFPIRSRRLLNPNHMANHPAGVRFAGDYHVAQVAVVVLDVALACAEGESLWGRGG